MLAPSFYLVSMAVMHLWKGLVAAVLALLACASTAYAAEPIRLEPCIGRPDTNSIVSNNGARAIGFTCEESQNRHGPGDFVVAFQFDPVRPVMDDPLVLRMASVWQDSAQLHFVYADGTSRRFTLTSAESSRWLQYGAFFELPVPYNDAPLVRMELQSEGAGNLRGVVLGASLLPRSMSEQMNRRLIALYASFAGLALALITFNLALWAALRHKFQLLYCLMVTVFTCYMVTSSGAIMQIFPDMANNDRLRINHVLLTMTGVTALWFVRHFFEARVLPLWFKRTIDLVCLAALASSILFAAMAPTSIWWLGRIYFTAMGLLVLTIGPVLWYAWQSRSRYRALFTLAWVAPVSIALARTLHGFGLVPYNFWLDNGNLIALGTESLLSALLIASRLREISSERDIAQAGEQSALRLASSDPLTGLLNRRAFINQAVGRKGVYRLLLIDVDRFKAINDRHGHDAGDEVLAGLARLLQAHRPPESLAVRLGGEEFALLLPASRIRECAPDALLAAIRDHVLPRGIRITASIGVAEGRLAKEEDWKRLYRLCDSALYRAKADGRDRFCRATNFSVMAAA